MYAFAGSAKPSREICYKPAENMSKSLYTIANSNYYILVGNNEHDEKIKTFFSILQGEENLFENQNFFQISMYFFVLLC